MSSLSSCAHICISSLTIGPSIQTQIQSKSEWQNARKNIPDSVMPLRTCKRISFALRCAMHA
ncbi:MAG TPA: hypothetical protein DDZ82_09385, partial [Rhodobacteraceae bacterium]|nr:hypothetical protein [Paracoccaceae bacterium]